MWFLNCPRCDYVAYEILKTHSYCFNCNYCPDTCEMKEPILLQLALEAIRAASDEDAMPLRYQRSQSDEDEDFRSFGKIA